ncbi:MAG: hypothetical protein MUC42_13415, partial [Bryobacter sp.]|nr:hypothetical protein [Bryobacter sp.]
MQWSRQELELAAQRLAAQRETAADLAVASLSRLVASAEQGRLPELGPLSEDSIHVGLSTDWTVDPPGRLAFLPEIPIVRPDPAFQPADAAEFSGDLSRGLALLQTLAQDPRPSRRAGAFLRQARIHRKAGQWEESLRVYSQLAE